MNVSVGTAPEHAREVLALVHGELDRMGETGITEREQAVAKGHLRAETLLSLEDSGARMSRIGSSLLLHGHVLEVDEVLSKVDAVTVDDVAAVAATLAAQTRTLSVVGPYDPDAP
jgi:predicted Zn-dependent peptidase